MGGHDMEGRRRTLPKEEKAETSKNERVPETKEPECPDSRLTSQSLAGKEPVYLRKPGSRLYMGELRAAYC